jgi:hypothetical protein
MRDTRLAALALVSVALAACGTAPPRSVFPSGDAALGRMKDSFACVNGVQGTAKIDRFAPDEKIKRVRGELGLMAVNPDRVRFDVIGPLGAMLFTLTADGQQFQMLDFKQGQLLHGPASPCNLARLTHVPIPGHALVSLLRGEAPVLRHDPGSAKIAWDKDEGHYRVTVPSTRGTEEILLGVRPEDWDKPWQQQRLRVLGVLVTQGSRGLYQAELKNHAEAKTSPPRVDPEGIDPDIPASGPACDVELPRSIRLRVPHTGEDVIFQYKEARWNPPIPQGAFTQPTSGPGIRPVFVDCTKP